MAEGDHETYIDEDGDLNAEKAILNELQADDIECDTVNAVTSVETATIECDTNAVQTNGSRLPTTRGIP